MAYCYSCGAELVPNANFCSNCGARVEAAATTAVPVTVAATPVSVPVVAGDYSVVLLSIGSCPESNADDVLQDLLGYSDYDAFRLISMLPAEVAHSLSEQQALYLSQALVEYGMDVAVYRDGEPVDFGAKAIAPVYQSNGNLVTAALTVLGTLTAANRLKQFLTWTKPAPPRVRFVPGYTPKPPVHMRRAVVAPVHRAEPRPRPVSKPTHHAPDQISRASYPGKHQPAGHKQQRGHGPQGGPGPRH